MSGPQRSASAPPGLRRACVALATALCLGACAPGSDFIRQGKQMIEQGRAEEGLSEIEKGVKAEPGNASYRMLLVRQREAQIGTLLSQADAERLADRLDEADGLYRRAQALAPGNGRAKAGLDAVQLARRQRQRVDEARALAAQGRPDEAAQRLRAVLAENPQHPAALALQRSLADEAGEGPGTAGVAPRLNTALRKPVTLDFRDANLKAVFEALSRSTGINFVFDRDVRPDIKVTLFITNMSIEDVIGVITVTNQLERKTLSDNTVLIYPNTAAKQKDYADLMVKTFYLVNAEAKGVFAMLKTVLKTRDLYADEKLNSITMRDTSAAVRLAEKIIAAQDLPEPEVMLEVEVLEVKRSRFTEIGIDPPGQFTVLNIVKNPSTVVSTATGATTVVDNTLTTTQLTLNQLRGIKNSQIGIANPSLNLRAENGDTNILANPRIRVKNRDKARILIGDRVPVITTTSTINVGVSESINYLDVGLKLDVEPNVFLDDEVAIKVGLEVSNIVKEIKSKSGALTYQIGTRMATTTLRLKDGETQALAGLISDEDRRSAAGVPGLTDLPLVGRLFSSERSDHNKTEIVLLVTPRVVRNISGSAAAQYEYPSGTEASVGAPVLRLHGSGKLAMPPAGGREAPAPGEAAPPPEPEPVAEPAPAPPLGVPGQPQPPAPPP
ncbi:secretin N-terminal domain-containing protein [Methylibium sp.]|uniref:secretin N-terminal domain-containing protein n=1 Tax=Methylibium sp. TaxID=2067992 RepID=UPI003D116A11